MTSHKSKWLTPLLLIVSAISVTAVMTYNRPENAKVEVKTRSLVVDIAEVVLQNLRIPIQAQGTVTPHRETAIVAEVGGKVIEVSPSFYAGGYVAKGELLLRIDDVEHQANLNRAKAAVASAESALAQERGRADVAQQEFLKFPNIHRTATAKELYLRKPQLKQAQAQLLSAQADLRKARHDLDRTVIRAPYDSLIKEKQSDLGLFLSPGTPVASLFAIDFAEVRLAIPQSKLSYLELPNVSTYGEHNATSVELYSTSGDEIQHWSANLHRTEGVYDERSRVLFTVARVDDPYHLHTNAVEHTSPPLRMGTFVSAVINGRMINDLVTLPRNILRAGNYLWIADQQNTLRNRKVSTLRTQGDYIYVTSGLQNGDRVILTPLNAAVAGTPVEISGSRSSADFSQTENKEAIAIDPPPEESPKAPETNSNIIRTGSI